jgi:lysophospholipase L1-like esterase
MNRLLNVSRRKSMILLGAALTSTTAQAANVQKKRVLAFGASNTWGFQPVDPKERILRRLPFSQRWTGVAQRALGRGYEIVEDALSGRTAGIDRQNAAGSQLPGSAYNGLTELPEALARNVPLDLVVLQLGTNDLMSDSSLSAEALCQRLITLCSVINKFTLPIPLEGQGKPIKAMLMAPTAIGPMPNNPNWERAETTRKQALPLLKAAGLEHGFSVFDGAQAVPAPGPDGLHFGPDGHQRLGLIAAAAIREALR